MLGRLLEARALTSGNVWGYTTPSAPWGEWPGDPGYDRPAGDALQLTTVLGCVRLISDSISTLPVDVFRRSGELRLPAPRPDWLDEPMIGIDFPLWCSQVLSSLLIKGNAYILVNRNGAGQIVELRVIEPTVVQITDGRYTINGRPAGEIVHIRGLMLPGSNVGLNPIAYARETIELGLSALRYGADFFDSDGNMPGVIELPQVAQPQTKLDLARHWQRMRRKSGRGMPGVIDAGGSWKATSVSNEDAQFLATRQFTAAEIAGQIFLLDPSDLGIPVEGTSLTYANLEQRNARRVQVTLLPWIIRIESALSALLAAPSFVKFNVAGLLRADMEARYNSYKTGIEAGFLDPNEARGWEDLPPLPDATDGYTTRELAESIQKIYLGVGPVLERDEAREILNRAGANLPLGFAPSKPPTST